LQKENKTTSRNFEEIEKINKTPEKAREIRDKRARYATCLSFTPAGTV